MDKPWYTRLYVKSPVIKLLIGILGVGGGIVLLLLLLVQEPMRMEAQTQNWDGRSIEQGAAIFANNCASCHGMDGQGNPGPALNSRYFFSQRLDDVSFNGSIQDYVALTVNAGRPSKHNPQWGGLVMATWGEDYGGPLRNDQVQNVARYVANWEDTALQQTMEEDPWIPFQDTTPKVPIEQVYMDEGGEPLPPPEPRAPEELWVAMACSGCHNLDEPQTEDNRGPIGPNMGNLAEHAGQRVEGVSAEDYVYTSIVNPNEYVVEGYQPGVMLQNFAQQMTEEEIRGLVDWLLDPNR
jgi:mono/diheme cytochrome c family protein